MAKSINKNQQTETQGESQPGTSGYGDGSTPPNPSDAIFLGRALPIIPPQDTVGRRAFNEPVRPPLHYDEGAGPDESTTSRRPAYVGPLGETAKLIDHTELRPMPGVDKQPYSHGPDDSRTTNGVQIRGT